ncbi:MULTISPECIES: efflux RND transporter periplasmic adaptor subunit [unclassified Ruegeria]|uniref:efflux RND transporter periplasmic adaptor subunit n=1 Tax=unclassified Ruegeria TaxID=2625375 RepID=UPI001487EC87|nr:MULTISPECIES: efflux RND transporter periplasmic adaptor subunit [unclassified Ruegeria]NOD64826.1 efflux RND transporter periplasmic adaptor subunit [Ruegeria sp. HKCCD6109]
MKKTAQLLSVLIALGLVGPAAAQSDPTAPSVVVASAKLEELQKQDNFVGRVVADQSVDLQARVEGVLLEVNFIEGGAVTKGDVLFRIEKRKYAASVEGAQAALKSAQASALSAKTELDRQQKLFEKGDVPQSVLDTAKAAYDEGQASVDEAQANLKIAQIALDLTDIISPLDGRIGLSAIDAGNIVNTDSGVLATVTSVDPILVSFFVSEPVLLRERRNGSISPQGIKLATRITLADGLAYETEGKVTYVGDSVSQDTDTIELRATFSNPDGFLIPGQFVSVTLSGPDDSRVLTVPRNAVQFDKQGYFVFSVDSKDTVHRIDIEIGTQTATRTQVKSGLKDGDRVVVQGLQKIHDGLLVKPVDSQS